MYYKYYFYNQFILKIDSSDHLKIFFFKFQLQFKFHRQISLWEKKQIALKARDSWDFLQIALEKLYSLMFQDRKYYVRAQ